MRTKKFFGIKIPKVKIPKPKIGDYSDTGKKHSSNPKGKFHKL